MKLGKKKKRFESEKDVDEVGGEEEELYDYEKDVDGVGEEVSSI
jgi:hypothetical protein